MSSIRNIERPPNRDSVCAVVVTYFPGGDFVSRLRSIQSQVAEVVIVDNASSEETLRLLETARSELGITVIHNEENLGIATALNQGTRWAIERKCAWGLLFDQDTTPFPYMLQRLAEAYAEFPSKDRLAVLGSNHRGAGSSDGSVSNAHLWAERKTVITSGSLVSLEALERIGPFRDEFFMDCVDFDFCLRARAMGFEIIEVTAPGMDHPIGAPSTHRFLWSQCDVFNHSPFRWYYKTRNNLMLWGEYFRKDPAWVLRAVYARIVETLLMLLFEEGKLSKLKYMGAGFCDGLLGRRGKIAE